MVPLWTFWSSSSDRRWPNSLSQGSSFSPWITSGLEALDKKFNGPRDMKLARIGFCRPLLRLNRWVSFCLNSAYVALTWTTLARLVEDTTGRVENSMIMEEFVVYVGWTYGFPLNVRRYWYWFMDIVRICCIYTEKIPRPTFCAPSNKMQHWVRLAGGYLSWVTRYVTSSRVGFHVAERWNHVDHWVNKGEE